jgi:hypothetical protein
VIDEQYRMIRDPRSLEEVKVPEMPLLIVQNNGMIHEARTLSGAVAALIGEIYFDAEDAVDQYEYRLLYARKESMRQIMFGRNVKVLDPAVGVIRENYAAGEDHPDYEEMSEPPIYLRIDSEKAFLLSLLKLGKICVLEREDSFLIRPEDNMAIGSEKREYIDLYKEYDIDSILKRI